MFNNCYMYNKPGTKVTEMAYSIEKSFLAYLKSMPPVEFVMMNPQQKNMKLNTEPSDGELGSCLEIQLEQNYEDLGDTSLGNISM